MTISIHALREEGDFASPIRSPVYSNFYPRPPRGGRRHTGGTGILPHPISIHALREEGDGAANRAECVKEISIHALREEGDDPCYASGRRLQNFYPRPPRGGRRTAVGYRLKGIEISIHALREEGDNHIFIIRLFVNTISIHALREEGDHSASRFGRSWSYFYPRPPRGGRLSRFNDFPRNCAISIHALREEGDPCSSQSLLDQAGFLSTPSARRATTWKV